MMHHRLQRSIIEISHSNQIKFCVIKCFEKHNWLTSMIDSY